MRNIAEKTDKMREYFDTCIKMARGEAKDADGKPIPRGKRMIASIAGLCVEIGINKDDFYAMQCGNADEQAFFKDTMLRYEMAADAMLAAGMIDNGTYRTLREQFKETSVESDKIVQVVFSTWNAPDDWEDYKELQQTAKENGLQIRQLKKLLDKAIKAGLK
jgi:hypothetical protein